jgi:glycosyltransferase involved in cell wall biosynthesis
MSNPAISVVLSVYNGERFLRLAVDSILNQTFSDFEFIIIDDCSNDSSAAVLNRYDDARIVRLTNESNLGLTHSLNRGLAAAHGTYIARMDADDVSLPQRFQRQIEYMEQHPDIGVLGTNAVYIDGENRVLYDGQPLYRQLPTPEYMPWALLWYNPLAHPTVMIRREVLLKHKLSYDTQFYASQDYDLWTRMAHFTQLAALPDVCLHYRILDTSISRSQTHKQLATQWTVMQRELKALLGEKASASGIETLYALAVQQESSHHDYKNATDILLRVYQYFMRRQPNSRIRAETIGYLRRLAAQARSQRQPAWFYVLWCLGRLSPRAFLESIWTKRV